MGRKLSSGGLEIRESSLRLTFNWQGHQCRETVKLNGLVLPPTPANIKYAQRLSSDIRVRIQAGNFVYGEFFPDSPRAEPVQVEANTFGEISEEWLKSKGQLEAATLDQYRTSVRFWKKLLGEQTAIADLTHQALASKIGGHPWSSAKLANNYLVALRGIMKFVFHGPKSNLNPMVGIENMKVVKKKPDPLTSDERDRILAELLEHYDTRIWAYFAFAFGTGMRPEEIIALRWGDIDLASGVVRIQRVRTFRGTEREGSKTHTERDVDLTPLAVAAIKEVKTYTYLKSPYVFENPVTNSPWHDERSQRDHYWSPTMKRLGIRQRRAYATRHTYATVALMGGINPAYIASQLGHSNPKMLFETYSRWIENADKGTQRAAMAALLSESVFPCNFPEKGEDSDKHLISNDKIGRRDWTRTHKPKKT